jgi:hypothetical protein
MIDKLVNSIHSQQQFWNTVHNIMPKRKSTKNNINVDEWFKHFKALLEQECNTSDDEENSSSFEIEEEESQINDHINRPISEEEVVLALRKLKINKAAGPDGITGEFLKNISVFIVPFLVKYFNALFDKGYYPSSWTESIILPLFKKGDVNKPGNYRGISLLNVCSKVFGFIINKRLQCWVEEHDLTGEFQAGFKKGYSTIDHMFSLMACVQKQLSLNRKLYAAFIDFEKCFDSIERNLLWPILLKHGIKGKLFRCIKCMYSSVKARVRCGSTLTDVIACSKGVKQGDICSPILFSLFINELAIEVIKQGRHGVNFALDTFELFILLLADDVVLLAETPIGLQRQLDSLYNAACRLSLKVNLDKSNIVVFRNGGYLGKRERWFFQGELMPVVNAYKYLGIYFSTRLSFVAGCKDIASKAKRALIQIIQKLRFFNNSSLKVLLKLFDLQVQPILQYGSEIWGLDAAAHHCEKVHLFALKKFLRVGMRTPNDLVYYELDRYPILITFAVSCVRYWLKLLHMKENRLPRKSYLMLCNLDAKGKCNWVTKVRECLFVNGFGLVWMNQGVGSINAFIRVFKQRLIDCQWQNVRAHINESERFEKYSLFSGSRHEVPTYLMIDVDRHIKFIVTKFRFGISDLGIHFYRYRNCNAANLICPLCHLDEENELHFVLCCPQLKELRKELIPQKFYRVPNLFHFSLLMATTNPKLTRNLCIFLYKAFQFRSVVANT